MRLSFDSTTQKQDTPVTVGQHTIVIENSAIRGAKSNPANQFLELELKIVEGPDKGRVIYDNLHLSNTNSRAVEIGKSRLSSICHAVGVLQFEDTLQLHGRPFVAFVGQDKEGRAKVLRYAKAVTA